MKTDSCELAKSLGNMADALVAAKTGPRQRFFTCECRDQIVLLLRDAEAAILVLRAELRTREHEIGDGRKARDFADGVATQYHTAWQSETRVAAEERAAMAAAAEMLWTVVANVSGGDWTQQSPEWQEAAACWRDNYFVLVDRK